MNFQNRRSSLSEICNSGYPDKPFIPDYIYYKLPILESIEEAESYIRDIDFQLWELEIIEATNKVTVNYLKNGGVIDSDRYCANDLELEDLTRRHLLKKRELMTTKFMINEWIINYKLLTNQ